MLSSQTGSKKLEALKHRNSMSSPPLSLLPSLQTQHVETITLLVLTQPPELGYSQFENYHAVQKELKQAGGRDLEWKSKYLDPLIETELLREYQHWAGHAGTDGVSLGPRIGRDANEYLFYSRLQNELQIDWHEVSEELRRR